MEYSRELLVLALFLIYGFCKIIFLTTEKKPKPTGPSIPQPPGALPLIGHLHLLHREEPVVRILGSLADALGPIFSLRIGIHRFLILSDWETAKHCLSINDKLFTRPGIAAGKYMGYNDAVFALAPTGPYWREIRKIATVELLGNHSVEKMKTVREFEVSSFLRELNSVCAGGVSHVIMSDWFENLTFNITIRKIAGKRFSGEMFRQRNSEAWRIKHAVERAVHLSGAFVASDAIPFLEWFDIGGDLNAMKETGREFDSVLESWLQEHVERRRWGQESQREKDFMDVLLERLDENNDFYGHPRGTVIKATALMLILTGTESTALALTWALSLLLNHPKVLNAVQEELDLHVGENRWVEESDISNLKYLQAVIKETLRVYPPGPVTGPREAMKDCYIKNYYVPKGTRLIVNLWKLHRDPQVWSDPNEFRPERFMATDPNVNVENNHFEYLPFSSGRRSCPGMNYGLAVVHLTLARLLQGFDISTVKGMVVDMREGLGLALPKLNPLELLIKPRLPMDLYSILESE